MSTKNDFNIVLYYNRSLFVCFRCVRVSDMKSNIAYLSLSFFALCAYLKQLDGELIRAGMSMIHRLDDDKYLRLSYEIKSSGRRLRRIINWLKIILYYNDNNVEINMTCIIQDFFNKHDFHLLSLLYDVRVLSVNCTCTRRVSLNLVWTRFFLKGGVEKRHFLHEKTGDKNKKLLQLGLELPRTVRVP